MPKFVRSSHFRHVFGTEARNDQCFDEVKTSGTTIDNPLCALNPKFMAVCLKSSGGGSFLVLPHSKVGRVDIDQPKFSGHASDVLDLDWNPFNDNMIASSSEDMKVMIWEVPDGGPTKTVTEPLITLSNHQRKVSIVRWHPTAEYILLSASHDNKICIWNLETGACEVEIECHPEIIHCVDWNYNGSLIATTCKDQKIRIIDPRTGEVKKESKGHEGRKVQQVAFLGETNALFTTGFSKMSERQYALWSKDLEQKSIEEIDSSNGVIFIRYDRDINLVWLIGKGDSIIRYYELKLGTVKEPEYECFWLTNFTGKSSRRGFGFMPKRGCNISKNEVAKIYTVSQDKVIPVSFTVPRKSELFQAELFPDTRSGEASLSAAEWLEGKDADPKLMPCGPLFQGKAGTATAKKKTGLGSLKSVAIAKKKGEKEEEVDVPKLLATVATLTKKVATLENTVEKLNSRVAALESDAAERDEDED